MNDISKIVDGLLEGHPLSTFITNPSKPSIVGKKLMAVRCPSCGAIDTLVVASAEEEDQGFYTINVSCDSCMEPTEMEIVLLDNTPPEVTEEGATFENANYFTPVNEGGLMNGNYLKFNSNMTAFIVPGEKDKEYNIVLDDPGKDAFKLNTRVTFKVISFRNGKAKIISMVNDGMNKLPSGTIFYMNTKDLQTFAKVSKARMNPSLQGRFAY